LTRKRAKIVNSGKTTSSAGFDLAYWIADHFKVCFLAEASKLH
jgi:hypothetical protein